MAEDDFPKNLSPVLLSRRQNANFAFLNNDPHVPAQTGFPQQRLF